MKLSFIWVVIDSKYEVKLPHYDCWCLRVELNQFQQDSAGE